MKKTFIHAFAVCFAVLLAACANAPTSEDAMKYHDEIISKQVILQHAFNDFEQTLITFVPEEMQESLKLASTEAAKTLKYYEGLEEFDDKSDLKDAAIEFATMYKNLADNEYALLVEYYSLPDSLYTTEVEEYCKELYENIGVKYDKAFKSLIEVQTDFAKTYNFEIEKAE